jgi:hypothetical protein
VNPSQFLPAGRYQGAIIALLADLTQGGIVPLRAKRRQALFRRFVLVLFGFCHSHG